MTKETLRVARVLITLSILAGRASAQEPAPGSAQQTDATDSNAIEAIVVTARRTNEPLQTTPVAVSALTSEALDRRQIIDITALTSTAPNVTIGNSVGGNGNIVSIRGQVQTDNGGNVDPSVGVYIDGVYVARAAGALLNLVDVQRVEVLRGPQGTLFGRNATGGAINILSNQPTGRWEGMVRARIGNYDHREIVGVLNVPIVDDEVALRLTGQIVDHGAYGRAVPNNDPLADNNTKFVRGILRVAPDDSKVHLSVAGDFTKIKGNDQIIVASALRPGSVAATLPQLFPVTPGDSLFNYVADDSHFYDSFQDQSAYPQSDKAFIDTEIGGVSATIEAEFDPVVIRSITGYRFYRHLGASDLDGTPYVLTGIAQDLDQKQFSQELQFAGHASIVDWLAGAYYFRETNDYNVYSRSLYPLFPGEAKDASDITNKSAAVYGQANVQITDALRFTGGLRYTADTRGVVLKNLSDVANNVCALPAFDAAGVCRLTQSAKYDYVSYTAGFDYKFSNSIFGYLKTSRAQRAGGFNIRGGSGNLPFDPEQVTDYEVGLKADLLDRHLRLNAALFYSDYQDVQRTIFIVFPGATRTTSFTNNAAKAHIEGAELEATVVPFAGLTLTGSLGLIDPQYEEFKDQVLGDRSNEPFVNVAKTTYSIAGDYDFASGLGNWTLHADYGHTGRRFFSASALASDPGYGLLNAQISLQVAGTGIEASVWGRNLTETKYNPFALDFYSGALGAVAKYRSDPRTYGITLGYKF